MKRILFLVAIAFAVFFTSCNKDDDAGFYNVTVNAGEGGTVAADNGKHKEGETLTFVAVPNKGYSFSCWSDGSQINPRTETVQNADIILVALFAKGGTNNNNQNNGENGNENNLNTSDSTQIILLGGVCWGGQNSLLANHGQQNYTSNFYFLDENGYGLGFEESYYKGVYDTTYEFSWYWYDTTYSLLVLNYGGRSGVGEAYVDIWIAKKERIKGWLYESYNDYIDYNRNNNGNSSPRKGTSVEWKCADNYDRAYLDKLLNEWRRKTPGTYIPLVSGSGNR